MQQNLDFPKQRGVFLIISLLGPPIERTAGVEQEGCLAYEFFSGFLVSGYTWRWDFTGTQGVQVLWLTHKGIGTDYFAGLSLRLCEHSASDIFLLAYFSVACFLFLFFFPRTKGVGMVWSWLVAAYMVGDVMLYVHFE